MDDASTTLNTIASQAISLSPLWGWRAEICWNSVNCRIFAEVLTFTTTSGQHEHWQFQVTHLVCQKLGTTVECQASPSIQIYRIVQVRYLGSINMVLSWSQNLQTPPHSDLFQFGVPNTCRSKSLYCPGEPKKKQNSLSEPKQYNWISHSWMMNM